ncbi:hypothetical protein [Bacillus atrophaeus]|uniref:hypothetical protein n=1 Tax=Bacillus atrophaeus TaxID=1452 RepID=UPI00077B07F8|nr:hypothetical protein [Bacillus atrophaeus]KXZ13248.1 hypothetical protein AXI57_15960 [Bacillus atrophaeus]MED4806346.1 hypothetical protein [Bacillus atrophaeus]UFD97628.1 hypothetical protein [Bacillus atrophaeus]GED04222.1 hypothetical protein BAT02nite_38660 [Bacillus atrophaeus]
MWEEKNYLGFFVLIFIGAIMATLFIISTVFPVEFMAFCIQHSVALNIIGGVVVFIFIVILGFYYFIYDRC